MCGLSIPRRLKKRKRPTNGLLGKFNEEKQLCQMPLEAICVGRRFKGLKALIALFPALIERESRWDNGEPGQHTSP
jgi:hypothetical protein